MVHGHDAVDEARRCQLRSQRRRQLVLRASHPTTQTHDTCTVLRERLKFSSTHVTQVGSNRQCDASTTFTTYRQVLHALLLEPLPRGW